MLLTNAGSSNSTEPHGWSPRSVSVTAVPLTLMLRAMCRPSVAGKLARLMAWPPRTQLSGAPRPTTRLPSARCAASESSSTAIMNS